MTEANQATAVREPTLFALAAPRRASLDRGCFVREGPDRPWSSAPPPPPAPRLSERARTAMRRRGFSPRTEEAYLGWMRRFHEFHGRRDPAKLGAEHVTAFLNDLATRLRVAAATQNQALAALLFLYREVLALDGRGSTASSTPKRACASRWC